MFVFWVSLPSRQTGHLSELEGQISNKYTPTETLFPDSGFLSSYPNLMSRNCEGCPSNYTLCYCILQSRFRTTLIAASFFMHVIVSYAYPPLFVSCSIFIGLLAISFLVGSNSHNPLFWKIYSFSMLASFYLKEPYKDPQPTRVKLTPRCAY